jgi:hypothetical protein
VRLNEFSSCPPDDEEVIVVVDHLRGCWQQRTKLGTALVDEFGRFGLELRNENCDLLLWIAGRKAPWNRLDENLPLVRDSPLAPTDGMLAPPLPRPHLPSAAAKATTAAGCASERPLLPIVRAENQEGRKQGNHGSRDHQGDRIPGVEHRERRLVAHLAHHGPGRARAQGLLDQAVEVEPSQVRSRNVSGRQGESSGVSSRMPMRSCGRARGQ